MTLTDFAKLTQKERDKAWAEMDVAERSRLAAWVREWAPETDLEIWWVTDEGNPRFIGNRHSTWPPVPDRIVWLPAEDPTAAYELLLWVREQDEDFRGEFLDVIEYLHVGYIVDWLLFDADWPDAIARAVVEAEIAVSAEAHRQVAQESAKLAQKFMDSLTGPEQHD